MGRKNSPMQTLFLDVDNTLIYSHRHVLGVPKRAAEFLNGKVQSFITERTYTFLSAHRDFQIVPVTTRSLTQYKRIENLLQELGCDTLLVCNGGILLHRGEVDPCWLDESLQISAAERAELPAAACWLQKKCGAESTHMASELFVYAVTNDSSGIADGLGKIVDTHKVDILCDARKVYCIPKTLNKGAAVQRFIQRYKIPFAAAAGDSIFDVPMLDLVDAAIVPVSLSEKTKNERKIVVQGTACFSDEICTVLEDVFAGKKNRPETVGVNGALGKINSRIDINTLTDDEDTDRNNNAE